MYRYVVDSVATYTPEDLILFRESPFASWMERLQLESPDPELVPDNEIVWGLPKRGVSAAEIQAEHVDWEALVHGEINSDDLTERDTASLPGAMQIAGGEVVSIETHLDEPARRGLTLEAMHAGADFILNGELALGQFACDVELLVRSEGLSDLGEYIYLPCETGKQSPLHAMLRLCFAADLLHSIQGILPAEMLVMREGRAPKHHHTEHHIQAFRDLKHQFMSAQLSFSREEMPDPVLSSHFGRWKNCARKILRQRNVPLAVPKLIESASTPTPEGGSVSGAQVNRYGASLVAALQQAVATGEVTSVASMLPPTAAESADEVVAPLRAVNGAENMEEERVAVPMEMVHTEGEHYQQAAQGSPLITNEIW